MKRQLTLTTESLDPATLTMGSSPSPRMGATVNFVGIVREHEANAPIESIFYEAFEPMVRRQFSVLFDEMAQRWPDVGSVRLVHRLGNVPVNQPSLWVEVIAPHRGEAFAACQWLIDEMKRVVPIWKRPVNRP